MAKRRADKDLNHDNWEEEDEIEDAGQFQKANADELKRRVIKVGRRSLSNTPSVSPFAKFGFGSAPTGATTVASSPASGLVNGSKSSELEDKDVEFLGKLKSLNECLLRWLKQHMESSPYCDFTPVFADYQRHLRELRENNNKCAPSQRSPPPEASSTPTETNTEDEDKKVAVSGGEKSRSTLGGLPPFQFVAPPAGQNHSIADTEDENYVPPTNDFTPVEETDAVYSKRCKLFYKKGQSYIDRGIGMLYVKPLNGKYQLLMRADTNLGNILLNILLAPSLPVSRLGKNNVAVVCIPNPPLDSENAPTTYLLRVKTEQDADHLRDTILKYKEQEY